MTANPDPEVNSTSPVYKKSSKVALVGNLTLPPTYYDFPSFSFLICKTEMITQYLPPRVAVRIE